MKWSCRDNASTCHQAKDVLAVNHRKVRAVMLCQRGGEEVTGKLTPPTARPKHTRTEGAVRRAPESSHPMPPGQSIQGSTSGRQAFAAHLRAGDKERPTTTRRETTRPPPGICRQLPIRQQGEAANIQRAFANGLPGVVVLLPPLRQQGVLIPLTIATATEKLRPSSYLPLVRRQHRVAQK